MALPLVLVADDESDIRLLLRVRLRRLPVEMDLHEAEDGQEALELASELQPDVVVLDHRMPGRTGSQVAADLRAARPDLPIAIFSAFLRPELEEEAEGIGVATFPKTDLEGLAAWVAERLDGRA